MHYIPVLCCIPCKSYLSVCVLYSILVTDVVKNFHRKKSVGRTVHKKAIFQAPCWERLWEG